MIDAKTPCTREEAAGAKKVCTRKEAAEIVGFQPQTLSVWAMTGKYLPFVKVGRSVRYKLADLEEFVERHTVGKVS